MQLTLRKKEHHQLGATAVEYGLTLAVVVSLVMSGARLMESPLTAAFRCSAEKIMVTVNGGETSCGGGEFEIVTEISDGGEIYVAPPDLTEEDNIDGRGDETIDENSSIEDIQNAALEMVNNARKLGYDVAADNLENYIKGGGDITISSNWLREQTKVVDAQEVNTERFEDTISQRATSLEDGESITFSDYWDRQITYNGRGVSSEELFYASGDSTLSSEGEFTITRQGDEIIITGEVNHSWHDEYDFHPGLSAFIPGSGNIPDAAMNRLETEGSASEFNMDSGWTTQYNEIITVE